jgi:predicted RNA binding protein YcfA (HicA-like mRNA interferase family)
MYRCDSSLELSSRDGFSFTERQGSQRIYRHQDGRRVVIHYHRATDTLTPYVLRNLLAGTRWTENGLGRLKLIRWAIRLARTQLRVSMKVERRPRGAIACRALAGAASGRSGLLTYRLRPSPGPT